MKPLSDRIVELAEEVAAKAFNTEGKAGELGQLCQAHLMLRRAVVEMRAAEAMAAKKEAA